MQPAALSPASASTAVRTATERNTAARSDPRTAPCARAATAIRPPRTRAAAETRSRPGRTRLATARTAALRPLERQLAPVGTIAAASPARPTPAAPTRGPLWCPTPIAPRGHGPFHTGSPQPDGPSPGTPSPRPRQWARGHEPGRIRIAGQRRPRPDPPQLAAMMDNVAVFVEDEPDPATPELLGLYEGTPSPSAASGTPASSPIGSSSTAAPPCACARPGNSPSPRSAPP